jgi:hypothetical protein
MGNETPAAAALPDWPPLSPSWTIIENLESLVVKDATGLALVSLYFEDDRGRPTGLIQT